MKKSIIIILAFLLSCSSGGGESSNNPTVESDITKTSTCGVVTDKELITDIPRGELVRVETSNVDQVYISSFSNSSGTRLVKFHGITSQGVNSYKVLHGLNLLTRYLSGGAYFVEAGENCVDSNGAILGQIFTPDGVNINELLLREGAAVPSTDMCSGELLSQCYRTIEVTSRPPSDAELDLQPVNIGNQCGTVKESALVNPVTQAELVSVKALAADSVIITRKTGLEAGKSQLIKLHGLTTSGLSNTANTKAISHINKSLEASAYLVVASQNCEITVQGGPGVAGQLYSTKGVSINEELIKKGYALTSQDYCSGELISTCYQGLQANAPVISDPVENNSSGGESGAINGDANYIDDFLWKPISDNTGKLAVLVNPYNVRIVVTGNVTETLRDGGSGNGRGTTGRGNRPGCDYGSNVKVEFYNQAGSLIPLKDGRSSVTIADGCRRIEFKL